MLKSLRLWLRILLLQITDTLWRVVVSSLFSDASTQYIIVTLFIP
jgi:hypothetical protein